MNPDAGVLNWNTKTVHHAGQAFVKYFYWIILILTLISLNGYINPFQIRIFGDVYPVKFADYSQPYQYFGPIEFQSSRATFYNVPFRYFLDEARYYILGTGVDSNLSQWLLIFLPLLLTTAATIIFFRSLGGSKVTSLILWSLWSFTTFNLYTASIHTHIIIAINLILIWLGLYYWCGQRQLKWWQWLGYVSTSSLLIILAFNYDLRIIILTLPGFLLYWIWATNRIFKFNQQSLNKIRQFGLWNLAILILVAWSFAYLIINYSLIAGQAAMIISRPTWGSDYYQIINLVTLSHPFWRIGEPTIFNYNLPSVIYLTNTVAIFLIITLTFINWSKKLWLGIVSVIGVLTFGFLAKQSNQPIPELYDWLYRFPYFSLARDGSRYYHLVLLLFVIAVSVVLNINNKTRVRYPKKLISVLLVIPLLLNFGILTTRSFGASSAQYPGNIQIYDQINRDLAKNDQDLNILWLPFKPTSQSNAKGVTHFSFTEILYKYPLLNLDTENKNYQPTSLNDSNFQNYLSIFGINRIVLADSINDSEIWQEYKIQYPNFDYSQYREFVTIALNLSTSTSIGQYQIYNYDRPPQGIKIVDSPINSKYLPFGQIGLASSKSEIYLQKIQPLITPTNCNNNPVKHLDFEAKDRIQIIQDQQTIIQVKAKYEEVPCVFFDFKDLDQELFLDIGEFSGQKVKLAKIENGTIQSVTVINDKVKGLIPIECDQNCQLVMYFDGYSRTANNFEIQLDWITNSTLKSLILSERTQIDRTAITNLTGTELAVVDRNKTDFLLLPYNFNQDFRLLVNDQTLEPLTNPYNWLLFDLRQLQAADHQKPILQLKSQIQIDNNIWISRSAIILVFVLSIIFAILGVFNWLCKPNPIKTN